jgi:uncharacterized protein YuzE
MALEFDEEANALYMKINTKNKIKKTLTLGNGVYLDVGQDNKPVGVEVILPRKNDSKDVINALNKLALVKN